MVSKWLNKWIKFFFAIGLSSATETLLQEAQLLQRDHVSLKILVSHSMLF